MTITAGAILLLFVPGHEPVTQLYTTMEACETAKAEIAAALPSPISPHGQAIANSLDDSIVGLVIKSRIKAKAERRRTTAVCTELGL